MAAAQCLKVAAAIILGEMISCPAYGINVEIVPFLEVFGVFVGRIHSRSLSTNPLGKKILHKS